MDSNARSGPVATDFSGRIVGNNPAVNKKIAENTVLGRAGVPGDLGHVVTSLLSEGNRWVNAQRIEVAEASQFRPSINQFA
jgi:hypothetical protein